MTRSGKPGTPPASSGAKIPTTADDASTRLGMDTASLQQAFVDNLLCGLGRMPRAATLNDAYLALALTVRDRLLHKGVRTLEKYASSPTRAVAYLSAEFLPGPHLANNLLNLGIEPQCREAMANLGYDLDELLDQEVEPGLGNGGLGRLAACYLDSLASLAVPAIGYGIRYEFGIFQQAIQDGQQVERTDKWLRQGNPWEIARPEISYDVPFGGRTEPFRNEQGRFRVRWLPDWVVRGVAYDTPTLGYRVDTCNPLRLWKAEAVESFDFAAFDQGDYYRAVQDKMRSENLTKVLYPNDEQIAGKTLRLQQQFFFVSCSLQDMLQMHQRLGRDIATFHEHWAIQLNDTHPALAVAELMRLLVDEHLLPWEEAFHITERTFGYTNHTLLPEALEKWPLPLFGQVLPRHLEIVQEMNRRFLEIVRTRFPGDEARAARMSLIGEEGERFVRMAHLATLGSRRINGVARLHSDLLQRTVLADFAELWPERFCNVTNGVTPRRFVAVSNPSLAKLLDERIGSGWLRDLGQLRKLESLCDDPGFHSQWREWKLAAKRRLAARIAQKTGIGVDPTSLFDVQAKRLHEYKRQHLAALHVLTLFLRLRANPQAAIPARTFLFAGKAAPGYARAKLIIRLLHAIGDVVNNDPAIDGRLKVVFFPNFDVKNAQHIYPAANLSEQISTAGLEASGTGNMKFALNGALTIGTLDGANVEIREEIGADNFFLFGLTADQVAQARAQGYRPRELYERNPALREVLDFLASGALANGDKALFQPLVDELLQYDRYLLLADYQSYLDCQDRVSTLWQDQKRWTRQSILSTARMGRFSSDRSIREYCDRVWRVLPMPIE